MNFYIHIGYPKCGSTLLQNVIFRNLTTVNLLNKDKYEIENEIFKKIITLNEASYNKNKNILITLLRNELEQINKTDKIMIRCEGFVDPIKCHSKKKPHGNDVERTILRINDLFGHFGKVNLISVIRKYSDTIESFFDQVFHLIKFNFTKEKLVNILKNNSDEYKFILQSFFYSNFINLWKNRYNLSKHKKKFVKIYNHFFNRNFFA
jgi:hypothetical protein